MEKGHVRYTTYHCGVAVIKDRSLLGAAMAKLAAYEDAEDAGKLAVPGDSDADRCDGGANERLGHSEG